MHVTRMMSLVFCALFFSIPAQGNDKNAFWHILNGGALLGSLGSFCYCVPKAIDGNSNMSLRLLVDALCVAGDCYDSQGTTVLNIACLLGSLGSLAVNASNIVANLDNPIWAARGVIDTLQIILALKRIYHNSFRNQDDENDYAVTH